MTATTAKPVPRHILPVIVLAQFSGTSLWLAGNAAMPDLQQRMGLPAEALGAVTTAVQLGFIAGTLAFALFALADRYSPRRLFLVSSLLGSAFNAAVCLVDTQPGPLLLLRFLTGFFLAGIYPVGMKIAFGWFDRDLGKALGFLVGALVLGTAAPHSIGYELPWQGVMLSVSAIATLGGLAMYWLVPDGPYLRAGARFDPIAIAAIFRSPDFRASSFGYFGHMWELYALWTFLPVYLSAQAGAETPVSSISIWCFAIIGVGSLGCVGGGLLSRRYGSARVAFFQLGASGLCCLLSPIAFWLPKAALLGFFIFWGMVVVGDSPQFSALNARYAPRHLVGSALTIVNCIGFAVTIISIQLLASMLGVLGPQFLLLLLTPGPILGAIVLLPLIRESKRARA
jgi:MFS family permease